jgi:hypothetical protein
MARGGTTDGRGPLAQIELSLPGTAPVYSPEVIYHVGTMRKDDAKASTWDQEGHCLSVSEHPDEWRQITTLTGDLWVARPTAPARFLEALELDEAQTRHIESWAISEGLVKVEQRWIATHEDDETDVAYDIVCETRDAALDEAGDDEEMVEDRDVFVGQAGLAAWGAGGPGSAGGRHSLVWDMMLIAFASEAGYDGVWWHETLAPESLSAPRGGLLEASMKSWSFELVPGRL